MNYWNGSTLLGHEDPLQEEMATHSSSLAWRIPWTELLPGGLQSIGSQRAGHGWVAEDAHTDKDRIGKQNNGSEEITENVLHKDKKMEDTDKMVRNTEDIVREKI